MPTPKAGDPFYLDGFQYLLGDPEALRVSDGTRVLFRNFYRPDVADQRAAVRRNQDVKASGGTNWFQRLRGVGKVPAANKAYQKNYNYKSDGRFREDHIKYRTYDEIRSLLVKQASKISNRVWADSAARVQASLLPKSGGAWTVEEDGALRLLLKPTLLKLVDPLSKTDHILVVAPQDFKVAEILCHKLLNSEDPFDFIVANVPFPSTLTPVRW